MIYPDEIWVSDKYAFKIAKLKKRKNILINLSGRGDKDIDTIASLKRMKV